MGAGGKLGRLFRAAASEAIEIRPVFREARAPGDLEWQPGQSSDHLPECDVVLALWGIVPGPERDLAQNAVLALAASELGADLRADRVIHCSSGAVYCPGPLPLSEADAPDPQSPYGRAKLEMEAQIVRSTHDQLAQISLRIGNVMGADSLGASLRGNGPIQIDRFETGIGPARSYIAASDFARLIETLCAVPPGDLPPVLNVAAPRATQMADIARAAGRQIAWQVAPATAIPLVELATDKLQALCPLPWYSGSADYLWQDAQRWMDVL